ncbi:MAG: ATP phosphoribosyltransferase, partial [Rhodospirillaceae bacterium]|nr:ATP phosphoribosyltransferase [Rhodospirillaceae bacterium]
MVETQELVLALPKGRILKEALPLLARAGIEPEEAFHDENGRQLHFATNVPGLTII